MTLPVPTDAACEAWFAAIRAQHRPDGTPDHAALARVGIAALPGGGNNAIYRCDEGGVSYCFKGYRTDGRRRDEREWRALNFLGAHLPGLAPRPFRHSPDKRLPLVAMEWVSGTSLLEVTLDDRHLDALAGALLRVYAITLAGTNYPEQSDGATTKLLARVEGWVGSATPPVRAALARWLAGGDPACLRRPAPLVFGVGDPNLANWLWDDGALRRVDLEYAGWCDLANELADLIEGPWARGLPDAVWLAFAARFPDLDRDRFAAARRLMAHFWLALFDARGDERLSGQLARAAALVEAG